MAEQTQGLSTLAGHKLEKGQGTPVTGRMVQSSRTGMETSIRELGCPVLSAAEVAAGAGDNSVRSQDRLHPNSSFPGSSSKPDCELGYGTVKDRLLSWIGMSRAFSWIHNVMKGY